MKVKEIRMHIYIHVHIITCICDMSYNLLFGISPHPVIKRKSQIILATHACSSSLNFCL